MSRWLIAQRLDETSSENIEESYKQSEVRHENDGSDEIGAEKMLKDVNNNERNFKYN